MIDQNEDKPTEVRNGSSGEVARRAFIKHAGAAVAAPAVMLLLSAASVNAVAQTTYSSNNPGGPGSTSPLECYPRRRQSLRRRP